MGNGKLWVDLGKQGDGRVGIDILNEKGVGFAGYSGTGKTNLVLRILTTVLDQNEKIELHLFDIKNGSMYNKLFSTFENVIEHESKIHKIRGSLNKLSKEVDRRKKKLDKSGLTYDEYFDTLKDTEKTKWKQKIVVVDCISVIFSKLRSKGDWDQCDKLKGFLETISEEGSKVGIIPIYVFMRTSNSEAPLEIISNLSILGNFSNPEEDHDRWDLLDEGSKFPKKTGELLIKTNTYKGYVKTYNIEMSIDSKEGLFKNWDPHRK